MKDKNKAQPHLIKKPSALRETDQNLMKNATDEKQIDNPFQLLVEQAGDAFFVLDYAGTIVDVNHQACIGLGYTREELLKMTISEVDIEIKTNQHKIRFWNSLESGQYVTFDGVHQRKNGGTFPVEIRLGRLDYGEKRLLLALARDITERKLKDEELVEAHANLRMSEERFRMTFEQAAVGVAHVSLDGRFLRVNQKFCDIVENTKEEMLTRTFQEITHPDDLDTDLAYVQQVLDGEIDTYSMEKRYFRKDHGITWINLTVSLLREGTGEPKYFIAVIEDINKRKRTEEVLAEQLQFQNLVSDIAKRFIGLSGVNLKQARQTALAEIGRYFEVDAVRLYRLSPQGDIIEMRNVWVSEHSVAVAETTEMHKMKYPHLAAHYLQGETVAYGCPDECPQLPDLLKILKFAKITAGVGVPLENDDSGVDVFALAKIQSEHVWPKDIVKCCKVLGQVLLSAMRRADAELSLQDNYAEIKQLKSRLEQENIHLRKEIEILYHHDTIIGNSPQIKTALSLAEQVADQEASVLVLGETGTGKELLAHAIHDMSLRKKRAMITVNCAALPTTLIEGELFGREKGAYTGALTKQSGRFELADKSTVFLDEIGDLPLEMQAKLLRVLQEGQFERLGSAETINVDVRVIAATNLDLEQAVREGRFRKDLFYRLSVFPITVPPLRDRIEDIPLLVWAFVKDLGKRMGKYVEKISTKSMAMLQNYTWPGNVRELRNVIERAMILHAGQTLHIDKIWAERQETSQPTSLEEVERNHIQSVLAKTNWKVSGKNGAGEALGLKESTLRAKMAKLGIKRNQ